MAFALQNWARVSTTANEPIDALQSPTPGGFIGAQRLYTYFSDTDTQATISASAYFNTVAGELVTGDVILAYSVTDGTQIWYMVTNSASSTTWTTIPFGGTITVTAFSNSTSSGASNFATVTMNATTVNALYDTPQLLVAAPGAGKLIAVDRVLLDAVWGSLAFSSGGAIMAQYDSTVHGGGTNACTTTVASTFLTTFSASQAASLTGFTAVTALSGAINKGLYLSNATGDFTGGTGCSLIANVWYRIVAAS